MLPLIRDLKCNRETAALRLGVNFLILSLRWQTVSLSRSSRRIHELTFSQRLNPRLSNYVGNSLQSSPFRRSGAKVQFRAGRCAEDLQITTSFIPDHHTTISKRSHKPKLMIQDQKARHVQRSGHAKFQSLHQPQDESASFLRTPGDELLAALGPLAKVYATPQLFADKLDLSYIDPRSIASDKAQSGKKRKEIVKRRNQVAKAISEQTIMAKRYFKLSLPSLLASYIERVRTLTDADFSRYAPSKFRRVLAKGQSKVVYKDPSHIAFLDIFNDRNLKWLHGKGYSITDLTTWEWILTAKSSEQAAARLTVLTNQRDRQIDGGKPVPTFVILFLLRRQDFNARCLRMLLNHIWDRLLPQGGFHADAEASSCSSRASGKATIRVLSPEISESTLFLMIVRLLRQARKVWPEAIVSISTMMTRYINGTGIWRDSPQGAQLEEQTSARLTFLYNRMLSLLAVPSLLGPFKSLAYHQRAQFIVLKRMSQFQPTLIITREGYRAVTAVQLAHKKTNREREWALMKALSWPPWKEDKLGIDREIGAEHGISRASEVLLRSKEAGNPLRTWEDVAGVLAGWDTDRSPTIQTRTLLHRRPISHQKLESDASPAPVEHDKDLWAARVRATRTVDEGWACFIAYKSQITNAPSQAVYYAMFEKLMFEAKRVQRKVLGEREIAAKNSEDSNLLPGDSKETFPVPGPSLAIYVRTPTPGTDEFFELMVVDKIKPSGRFLGFLLNHARTFDMGMTYLKESSMSFSTIQALLGQEDARTQESQAELELMEDHLFAAFISFLSRFAPYIKGHNLGSDYNSGKLPLNTVFSPDTLFKLGRTHVNPLLQAFQLMGIRKPYYRPPWIALLAALARPGRVVSSFQNRDHNVQDTLTWKAMCDVLNQMQEIGLGIDLHAFQILCVGLEKAVLASHKLLREIEIPSCFADRYDRNTFSTDEHESGCQTKLEAKKVLSMGIVLLKNRFIGLVGTHSGSGHLTPQANELSKDHDPRSAIAQLPRLLEVPGPAHLHVFIRVLGLCQDYIGLLELMRWMEVHTPELMAVANEPMNGMHLARRCLVAVRVFLERSWLYIESEEEEKENPVSSSEEVDEGAPQDVLDQIYQIIEKNKDWGGWPTDEEVMAYCSKGRFI